MTSHRFFLLPNWLSYFRLIIGFILPLFLLISWGPAVGGIELNLWLGLLLFFIGFSTDYLDGWLARKHGLESAFGRILDPTADKILILSAMSCFAARGIYSYWFLVPIFLREIAVTVSRIIWLKQGKAVGAERAGKIKFGFQVASVIASFLYLFYPQSIISYLNQGLLITAVLLTLYSGYHFFKTNAALLKTKEFGRIIAALGVGFLRPFPGTYGTLIGMAVVLIVSFNPLLHALIFLCFMGLGYWAIGQMGLTEHEDPLEVVIDEVCGVLLAFWFVPLRWEVLLTGFFAFRFFDVTKIFPIGWFEKKRGAHGILWDDLAAGVYTWLVLRVLFW